MLASYNARLASDVTWDAQNDPDGPFPTADSHY